MENIINKIKQLLVEKQANLLENFNFGICDATETKFREKIGLGLDETFYMFYREFNGISSAGIYLWMSMSMLPVSRIISEKELMDKLEKQGKFSNWQNGTWWNINWIPFLTNNSNSLLCIDTIGSFNGIPGQVIQWNNDNPSRTILFESFEKWLEALYILMNEFEEDIIEQKDFYTDYCISEIENISKKLNSNYPKFVSAIRISIL